MGDARITIGQATSTTVPETILGHNIEMVEKTVRGFLTDRLENAKFAGPVDANGFPPPWRATADHYGSFQPSLAEGISMSGGASQRMTTLAQHDLFPRGMVQTKRQVRAGESLEVEFWAKIKHHAAGLRVSVAPAGRGGSWAAVSEEITVTTTYWKRYTATFTMPADDDEAVFNCSLITPGDVFIDQIHLRPVGAEHVSADVVASMASMRVPVLRFPGGCLATNYHWRKGTGPLHERPSVFDPANNRLVSYDFGTDEYLELCHQVGAYPHLTLNLGSGTPVEAADWAAYVAQWYRDRNSEPPPAYFQVGNEEWGLHELSNMSGDMYADTLRDYVPAIRAAYPNPRIVALGHTRGVVSGPQGWAPWLEPVLAAAHNVDIDVLVLHLYVGGRVLDDHTHRILNATCSVSEARRRLVELRDTTRAAGVQARIGVTEWNYLHTATHFDGPMQFERSGAKFYEHYDTEHCLFTAGMIHLFADLAPDFELGNFYHFMNACGVLQRPGIDLTETALADLFRFYRPAFPGHRVTVKTDGPALPVLDEAHRAYPDVPAEPDQALDTLCVHNDEGTWLFVANRSPDEEFATSIDNGLGQPADVICKAGTTPAADFTDTATASWSADSLVLPPLSITRIHWSR